MNNTGSLKDRVEIALNEHIIFGCSQCTGAALKRRKLITDLSKELEAKDARIAELEDVIKNLYNAFDMKSGEMQAIELAIKEYGDSYDPNPDIMRIRVFAWYDVLQALNKLKESE